MTDPTFWNQALIWPIMNLLVAFYKLFESLHIPGALGFAVILLTITIRVILYPFTAAQLKSAKKMQKLKPKMDELQAKHKEDKQALSQAQMALYKEHGVNPTAGCLPLLLQMPVLIALYRVFFQVLSASDMTKIVEDINKIVYAPWLHLTNLDLSFFGFNLAIKPSDWQQHGWWLLAIPVITGLLQWYQTKLMMNTQPANVSPLPATKENKKMELKKLTDDNGKQKPENEDMAAEMQKQMAIISPIMFGFFAYQFPIGLALYWNVFGLFGIMQQQYINKKHN